MQAVPHPSCGTRAHLSFLPRLGVFFPPHLVSEQSLCAEQPALAPCSSGTRGWREQEGRSSHMAAGMLWEGARGVVAAARECQHWLVCD